MNASPRFFLAGKSKLWLLILLGVLVLGGLFMVLRPGAGPAEKPAAETTPTATGAPSPALTVTVAQPETQALEQLLEANGSIAAWQEASVGAELSGLRLATVNANVGDVVRKGQVLAVLAGETTQAESLQAKAALAQAEAARETAKADADRARSIQDSGALSASQIAQYLMQEKVAQAQWDAAKAAYAATEVRLANTRVLAPDDGVISARPATVGAVVGSGQELFRLVRQGRLEWRAEVTADEVVRVQAGQKAQVMVNGVEPVTGTVRAVAPTADPQTRNVLVYVDLPRQAGLRAGTFARGSFALGRTQALTVPAPAVVVRDGHSYVFVIDAEHKAEARKIGTGRRTGDRVEVLEGLKPQDAVAVQGAGFLNDGDLVKVSP
ncbi:efflux RND transporter periplasmic adaptor subunit [Hydrogenophaga electricum]|uniref:Secretion protein HlyD n=1 Tax=Hydrogenophaga electricum TaxID=1230953 RepID=A0ABQ6BZA1_9BURK|nr:efflux RND transporter periplasmic adaptor subunit [Hydrogenophaga electricum]GLS12950.1 secretion protein HlyD [Hydrogenophaga electricum]